MGTNPTVFVVSAVVPPDATQTDVKQYIRDALGSWGGSFHPDDPLFKGLIVTVRKLGDRQSFLKAARDIAVKEMDDRLAQIKRYEAQIESGDGSREELTRFIGINKIEADCAGRIAHRIRDLMERC